jgi:carbon-monoxide dehydrogenase large subunit
VAAIDVTYERLDAVVDPGTASPTIHDAAPDNVAFEHAEGDEARIEAALDRAAHVVELDIGNQRLVQNPVEPRGALVDFDATDGELTYQGTTQIPHKLRRDLAAILDYPERRIRVAAPDMGGGFGSRCVVNPEEPLLAWCAMHLERPLRWRSTRRECYETDTQGRGVETTGRLGLTADGDITGLRIDLVDDLGAYLSGFAPGIAITCTNVMTGQYDIPETYYHVTGQVTNTAPSDAYRGVIEAELIHTLERLVDLAAHEAGLDPVAVRRRNLVSPDAFPYVTASGGHYDSGEYERALDLALDHVGYEELRAQQADRRDGDPYLGVGVGAWIEKCGFGCGGPVASWEYSNLQVHPDGTATVYVGTHNHGQGHETTYAQVVSDRLGIPLADVEVVEGDTGRVREGVGTSASRSALTAGNSID